MNISLLIVVAQVFMQYTEPTEIDILDSSIAPFSETLNDQPNPDCGQIHQNTDNPTRQLRAKKSKSSRYKSSESYVPIMLLSNNLFSQISGSQISFNNIQNFEINHNVQTQDYHKKGKKNKKFKYTILPANVRYKINHGKAKPAKVSILIPDVKNKKVIGGTVYSNMFQDFINTHIGS